MTKIPDKHTSRPAEHLRADARQNHARLLTAASEAFSEHGADAPLEDIARRAGVGIGTLYRHFPTRLDLQAAAFRNQVSTICGQAEEMLDAGVREDAFFAWIRIFAGYMASKRGLSKALMEALGKDSEIISTCWTAMRDTTERTLLQAQKAGVIRSDVSPIDVMRLVHGAVSAAEHAPDQTPRLLSIVLDGLRPQPGRPQPEPSQPERLQIRGAVLERRAQHHRGAGGDAAEGTDLLQEFFQRGRGGDPDLEDVVLLPRHAVAGLDRGQVLEPGRHVVGCRGVEGLDRYEGGERQADVDRVENGDVPLDHAVLL